MKPCLIGSQWEIIEDSPWYKMIGPSYIDSAFVYAEEPIQMLTFTMVRNLQLEKAQFTIWPRD